MQPEWRHPPLQDSVSTPSPGHRGHQSVGLAEPFRGTGSQRHSVGIGVSKTDCSRQWLCGSQLSGASFNAGNPRIINKMPISPLNDLFSAAAARAGIFSFLQRAKLA